MRRFMKTLPKNVWILTIAQSLVMAVSSLVVFVGGIVGAGLAPSEKLATLPVAAMIVGTAISVLPVTGLMQRLGRRNSFSFILAFSISNALATAYALHFESFYFFCFNALLFGVTNACVMQFRFAAMESVSVELIPNAASAVLIGGIAAAFVGPEIALAGRNLYETEFAGSFFLLAGVFLVAFVVLRFFRNVPIKKSEMDEGPRPLKEISSQRVFWVALTSAATGYMIMSFIMTATPVSMNIMDHHSLSSTKWVIQSHIIAMYAPSVITGFLIRKVGISGMMISGLVIYVLCIAIAFAGHDLINYWVSLIFLGLGWNFLFIGGTSLLPLSYRPAERFRVQALNDFVVFGSQAIASLSAGWLVFAIGWESMLIVVIPIIVLQGGIVLRSAGQP